MAYVPILSRTHTSSTLVPGVAFPVASASHVCTGKSGALTAKAKKKPANSHFWVSGSMLICESSLSRYVGWPASADTAYRPDDRGEHHQTAGELEDQELDRGLLATLAAEPADEEVPRDQRGLEEHVEEEDVGRHEHAQRQGLERESPGEERLGVALVGVEPRGADDDGHEQGGEQHEHQGHAVDAERVVGAEDVDPLVGLGELEAAIGVVLRGHHGREHEREHREAQRDLLGLRLVALVGQGSRHDRADERHDDQGCQPGEVVHEKFTARSARMTRRAPPSSESA